MPRQFLKNTTYFITRRITQRQYWLKPTGLNKQIFMYCLAVAAQRAGVQVHAVCVMSNHWHGVISDPNAKIAEFYGWLHEYVAKAVNCSHGRWEGLWSTEKTSVIPLESHVDVIHKIAYTLCNPVSAQLIAQAKNWKGVWLYAQHHSQTVMRPAVYFRKDGDMPESVLLELTIPPCFEGFTRNAYEQMVQTEVARREHQIVEEMNKAGKRFMGMEAVMMRGFNEQPRISEPRRHLNPRVSATDNGLRNKVIRRYRQFVSDYLNAREEWRRGNRDVIFPPGTYALRIHAGVIVQSG